MKKTPILASTIAGAVLTAGGLFIATPAHAAPTGSVTDNGDGTATVVWGGFADPTRARVQIWVGSTPPPYSIPTNATSGTLNVVEGMSVETTPGTSVPLPAGEYEIKLIETVGPTTIAQSSGPITIGSGGGGGASSDAAASTPVEVSLSLDLAASGASCKEGSAATGVMGAWMYLPAADDCSSTTNPGAKLLGWSTSANFPVERAQSQVDNRWGAIDEVFDGVRMIFIPAGEATFVSGPNSLHPIWAS